MKKSIYLLGMAVAALSSCSQSDVVEMPENTAIKFNSFVNNNTRGAVTEIGSKDALTDFYIYGYHSSTTPVFENIKVTNGNPVKTAYWLAGKNYNFAAYANGNDGILGGVTFTPASNQLQFATYTPDNTKDLVAAISSQISGDDQISVNNPVGLSFKHMLSQVKFTFTSTDSPAYTMKISDIKISNAVKTATGTLTGIGNAATVAWSNGTGEGEAKGEYDFGTLNDIAEEGTHATSCLVIPQDNENLEVTFTATFFDASSSETEPIKKGNFKASLAYTKGEVTDTEDNKWTPGYRYNYTATINADKIDPSLENQKITFKVEAVDTWKDGNETGTTPVPQP